MKNAMKSLVTWWRKRRQERLDRLDIEEYIGLNPSVESSAWYAKFREWKRKKYTYCGNCSCPELYHKDGLLRSWCELCDCMSFVAAHPNCRCTDHPVTK